MECKYQYKISRIHLKETANSSDDFVLIEDLLNGKKYGFCRCPQRGSHYILDEHQVENLSEQIRFRLENPKTANLITVAKQKSDSCEKTISALIEFLPENKPYPLEGFQIRVLESILKYSPSP